MKTKILADFQICTSVPLKSDSHLSKRKFFFHFNESTLQVMKNAFYFISKALFVLKIFKIWS